MKLHVTKRYRFSAAHQLHSPHLTQEGNEELYGKCANTHGHEYLLEITWRGPVHPDTGRVLPPETDRMIQEKLLESLNHSFLNRNPLFHEVVPTGENILKILWTLLRQMIQGVELVYLKLYETRNNAFEYDGNSLTIRGSDAKA